MCLHVDLQTGSLVFQCLPITADAMPTEGCFNVKTTQANTRNHHIPGHSLYSRDAVHRQKKTTWTTELIYSKCMKQTGFMTCKTQSSKKFRTLRKENKENLYCLWAKSRVTFHTITSYESCLACQHFLSNQTNHKLCKKLADQKCLHMSLRLCGIRKQYCALIRRHSYNTGV